MTPHYTDKAEILRKNITTIVVRAPNVNTFIIFSTTS